jgi:hypothetical protein
MLQLNTELEKIIFNRLVSESKVIMLFDAFDEISEKAKLVVVTLMETMIKQQSIRVYISTRPEWCEELENKFFEFKYSLLPFSEEDQTKFLELKFGKSKHDPEECQKFAAAITELVQDTFKEKDFYGR